MIKSRIFVFAGIISLLLPFNIFAQDEQSFEGSEEAVIENAEEAVPEVKDKRVLKTDDFLKLAYYDVKKTDLRAGKLHVSLNRKTGSFKIYAVDQNGAETPVLADFDGAVSSFVSVLLDKKEYRLNREAGVKAEVREFENGNHCQICYKIDEKVQVVVDFKTTASDIGVKDDVLKVTVYVTNLSKKTIKYSLKMLLDTVLGENYENHFVSGSGIAVKGETSFETMANEKWIMTAGDKTGAQIILNGPGISNPQQVMLANRDILSSSSVFKPNSVENRSFSSVLAYNNSAVCINWPQVKLSSENTNSTVFYIAVGTDGEKPAGDTFLTVMSGLPPVLDEVQSSGIVEDGSEVETVVTEEQLDDAYIKNLIDRINSLQSDPDLVDRTEVKRLNKELDAIFEKLRQK